jgi:two-component system response regulator AtoC
MARYGTAARRLSPDALSILEAAPWRGNVRELRHLLEEAAVLCDGDTIDASQERAVDAAARRYFHTLMKHLGGNVTKAAVEAGMERETLHRLLRRYEVDPSQFRS